MISFIFKFLIILFYSTICLGNAVDVKLITFGYDKEISDKILPESKFAEYATSKNLSISINIEPLLYDKSTDALSYFKSLIESLLKKQNNPYDIYLYSSTYTSMYGPYLLNLNLNLPKEHIEMYNSKVLKEECSFKDELVGLKLFFYFTNYTF